MTRPRPLDGGDSFWLEENPLSGFDPLRETTAQSRALRKGEPFIPFEARQPRPDAPTVPLSLTPATSSTLPQCTASAPLSLLARANGDPALSYMGLKVLLAVLAFAPGEPISLSRFSDLTGLSKTGVISGIRNSLDAGYVTRSQSCPRCQAALPFTEDKKTVSCQGCKREVPPQARYAVCAEDSPIITSDSSVFINNSLPVTTKDSPVPVSNSPVAAKDSPPVSHNDRGAVAAKDSPVTGNDSLVLRAAAFASQMLSNSTEPVFQEDRPVVAKDSPPVSHNDRSHARADSESRILNRDSDSRFPAKPESGETGRVVYGSQGWQQMTERLAKDSAKRIGDKSVGFHVKCWAHARKIDWEQGGRRCEEGLLAIAQELEGKNNAPGTSQGRGQGALWTKMVRRFFEEKGHPLLTEAEQEEWKELHGSYQPP